MNDGPREHVPLARHSATIAPRVAGRPPEWPRLVKWRRGQSGATARKMRKKTARRREKCPGEDRKKKGRKKINEPEGNEIEGYSKLSD